MKRVLMGLLVGLLGILVLGAGALVLVDADQFRPQVQRSLSRVLGRPVTVGKLHVALRSGELAAGDIRIGDDPAFASQPFVTARSLHIGVHLWSLLAHRQLRITSLTLEQPDVRLLQDRSGGWNFATLGARRAAANAPDGSAPAFTMDRLRITNGSVTLHRAAGGTSVYGKVFLSADHVGAAGFPFSMTAAMADQATLKLDGKLGRWNAGNAAATPLDAHLRVHGLDLVRAGLMGGDGVGGGLDLDARVHFAGGELRSQGHLDLWDLQLVAAGSPARLPVRIDYHARYRAGEGKVHIEDTTLGSQTARLSVEGSVDIRSKLMQLDLRVAGTRLPVDDLQPLLPAFGVVLPTNSRLSGGTATVDLAVRGPLDALVIRGPVALDDTRLAGYSLDSELGGMLALAGIKAPKDTTIRHADARLVISPSGIQADPVRAEIAGLGSLAGSGSMAVDHKLFFRMRVKLDKALADRALGGKGSTGERGSTAGAGLLDGVLRRSTDQGIRLLITGTASSPSFLPDPNGVAGLIKGGAGGAIGNAVGAPRGAAVPVDPSLLRKKQVLDALRGALGSKKDQPPPIR
jgi:AsmA protein